MAKILLVIQDEERRKSCAELLKKHGRTVEAVENTDKAIKELAAGERYDIVLSDFSNLQKLDSALTISKESDVIPVLLVQSDEEITGGRNAKIIEVMSSYANSPIVGHLSEAAFENTAAFQEAMDLAIRAGEMKATQASRLGRK